ncbi:MAG: hypothetical protein H0W96_02925 [Solirubrobacterales bacterium]|nr:hypothetical protein [Solirubrobacterales bacterium]
MLSVRDLERLAFCSPARGAGKVVLLVEAIFASPDTQTSWPAWNSPGPVDRGSSSGVLEQECADVLRAFFAERRG